MDAKDKELETYPPMELSVKTIKIGQIWAEIDTRSPKELEALSNGALETETGFGNAWYIRLISGK